MTVLSFEALLFTIAIAFILLAMAKERTEHRHKTAALIDPLTGIANRRAFLQDGEAHLKRQATDPRPTAVMLLSASPRITMASLPAHRRTSGRSCPISTDSIRSRRKAARRLISDLLRQCRKTIAVAGDL
jgi:hypothetical protein